MANKYLEKIASFGGLVNSLGRIAKNTGKAVLNQVHLADGGGYRSYAHANHYVKNIKDLSEISGSKEGVKALKRHAINNFKNVQGHRASIKDKKTILRRIKKDLPELRNQQTDARIVTGGLVGGGTLAGYRIKKKLEEPNIHTYNY